MKLTYGQLLSPSPIKLSIGTLRKPTLREISDGIGFDQYSDYEGFLKLTPELFYTKLKKDGGIKIWESFTDKQKEEITLFNVVVSNDDLLHDYLDLLNYFFEEQVIFAEGFFVWIKNGVDVSDLNNVTEDDVLGVVTDHENFTALLEVIQQVCCCYDNDSGKEEQVKYKNSIAEKLHKKMMAAEKEQKKITDKNYTLPNIISAISNFHPTISPINVWDLTVFQLVDSFNRNRVNMEHLISTIRVSVWGDSDNKYDSNVWFRNEYDK